MFKRDLSWDTEEGDKESETVYTATDRDSVAKMSVKHPINKYAYYGTDHHYFNHGGQGELFYSEHRPAKIQTLHASGGAPHLVTALLAHAHRVHKGDLTYSDDLSPYSSPIVKHAVEKGYVKQNPEKDYSELEDDAEYMADSRAYDRSHKLSPAAGYGPTRAAEVIDEVHSYHEEVPQHEIAASKAHLRTLAGTSRFKPKAPTTTSDSQLTLPGM